MTLPTTVMATATVLQMKASNRTLDTPGEMDMVDPTSRVAFIRSPMSAVVLAADSNRDCISMLIGPGEAQ